MSVCVRVRACVALCLPRQLGMEPRYRVEALIAGAMLLRVYHIFYLYQVCVGGGKGGALPAQDDHQVLCVCVCVCVCA